MHHAWKRHAAAVGRRHTARSPHNGGEPQNLLGGSRSDSADSALALGHCHERGRCVLDGLAAAVRAVRMGRGVFREMLGFLEHMAALLAAVLVDGHGVPQTRCTRRGARVSFILGQRSGPRSVKVRAAGAGTLRARGDVTANSLSLAALLPALCECVFRRALTSGKWLVALAAEQAPQCCANPGQASRHGAVLLAGHAFPELAMSMPASRKFPELAELRFKGARNIARISDLSWRNCPVQPA